MDYDNTDRGSFFKPRADESLLVQGNYTAKGMSIVLQYQKITT